MEELLLNFNESELELIEKGTIAEKFDFPVIYFGKETCYFNKRAYEQLRIPRSINWFVSPEYVLALPAPENSKNAYKINVVSTKSNSCRLGTFPHKLANEKKLRPGYYKLLKYKDGFAFKRYEQIELS